MGTTIGRMMTWCLFGAVTILLIAQPAIAQKKKKKSKDTTADAAVAVDETQIKARESYGKAKAAYDAGDFATALVNFQDAYNAKPHPSVLKSIAECHAQLGQFSQAIDILQQLIDDPSYDKKEDAQVRRTEILAEVYAVSIETTPVGAAVAVDGVALTTPAPVVAYLLPGAHQLTFTAEGLDPQTRDVTAVKGEETTLSVDLTALPPAAVAATLEDPFADEAESTPEVKKERKGPPPAFWAMAAVTGVGLVAGTVFGTSALRDQNDYEETGNEATKESGERSAVIADISFGVAIAAAVAGTIILIVDHSKKGGKEKKEKTESARFQWAPAIGSSSVGLNSAVSF